MTQSGHAATLLPQVRGAPIQLLTTQKPIGQQANKSGELNQTSRRRPIIGRSNRIPWGFWVPGNFWVLRKYSRVGGRLASLAVGGGPGRE